MQDAPYREIALRARNGSVRAVTKVSPEDYEWLSRWRWKLTAKGYAQRTTTRGRNQWTSVRMARAILGLNPGDPRLADHVNRDRLDNRRSNLRIIDAADSEQNVGARGGTSGFRGVFRDERSERWYAKVGDMYLGSFVTEPEAAAAAKVGRLLLFPYAED
jgi:hypothetical protein